MSLPAFARRSAELLQIPVIDGHNDLAWAHRKAVAYDLTALDIAAPQPSLCTDLPRLRRGGVVGQFWSVYVPTTLPGSDAVVATMEQIEFVHRLVRTYPGTLSLALTSADAEAAIERGRIASFLGAEGGHSIAGSLQILRDLYLLGVRYLTLTHNRNVGWADSCTDEPTTGLSGFGETVVVEMNRLGMLVDLSHVSADTARAALRVSQAPVIFSHSSCRAICDHPRDVPDDVLRLIPGNGGVIMITFVPSFISSECADWEARAQAEGKKRGIDEGDPDAQSFVEEWESTNPRPRATVAQVADHVEHARELAGAGHIGLGGDFDGSPYYPMGLEDVSCYPNLMQELADRGWSDEDLRRLGSSNVLAALRGAEAVAADLGGDHSWVRVQTQA
ncbi:MAG: dipeptidase [Candidatus Dormiibacterota bacterium]